MFDNTIFKVKGMTCEHCESSVIQAVSAVDGIKGVKASAAKGIVKVKGKLTDEMAEKVKAAIEEAGFSVENE